MANNKTLTILLAISLVVLTPHVSRTQPMFQATAPVAIPSQFTGMPVVEPHISAHPDDPGKMLVTAMVVTDVNRPYQSCRLSSFYSADGGHHWVETAHDYWGYDPWSEILPSGQAVMTWLGTEGSFRHAFPAQFFISPDAGRSWPQKPQTAHNPHGHDGTKLAAYGEAIYFTTVKFKGDMSADVALYGREQGGAFEELAVVDAQGLRLNFCEPAVLTDGTVIIPASHYLRSAWIQRYDPESKTLSERHVITDNPGGGFGYMRMAVDQFEGSSFTNRLYFVRAAGRDSTRGVWLNYSSNGGDSWSPDIQVDQFTDGQPSLANVASVAVTSDGTVGVSWVDRRANPNANDVYFATSTNGGASFSLPMKITEASTEPKTPENADVANKFPGGGHYLGLAARADGSFQIVWSETVNGVFQLQTSTITRMP